jgi:hypothetical protein
MNLPFEISPRKMDSRSAADAGFLLWRECFVNFLPFFAIPLWLCAFALRLLPGNLIYFSWLILWFLKPLFDRPVLHIISVRFFESNAGIKHFFKGLGKTLWRGLPGDLLWRRFSPLRAAMMPIRTLEYSSKKSIKETVKRKELLKRSGIGYCFLLTCWGIVLEITLLSGEITFFMMITNLMDIGNDVSVFTIEFFRKAEVFIFPAWCINYILIESLYVCMGFSLYINSRIEVEGWDIEIMFRNFAKKLKKSSGILILLVFMFLPVNAFTDDFNTDDKIPMEKLHGILSSPDFGGEKDSWGIRFKKQQEERDNFNFNPSMEKLRFIFAFILRFIIVVLITALIIFIIFYVRRFAYKRNSGTEEPAITILHGISLGNPELILQRAVEFFEQGNLRLAWGYCTTAGILSWTVYCGLSFPPDATESECVKIVSSSFDNDKVITFNRLINHWINFVYAGRLPPDGSFEEAVDFCKSMRIYNG